MAASSSVQSKPRTRAFTVSATKLTSNMTWAMMIVPKPVFQPQARKSVSSEEPSTTSGAVSGMTRNRLTPSLPRKRWRTSATATSVPSTVAMIVEMRATSRLTFNASASAGYLKGCFQASSEKPFQVRLNLPTGALKLKMTMTASGMNR